MWSILFQFLFYLLVFSAVFALLVLMLSGHWLGTFYAVLIILLLAIAIVIGLGEAYDQPWAKRLSRILFMR